MTVVETHRPTEVVVRPAVVRTPAPLAATSLSILAALLLGFVVYLGAVSPVEHARTQALAYAQLREDLANGVAPLGQSRDATLLAFGTPLALLEVPGTGTREVIREGTSSGVLAGGPGHRRDTALPGQAGTSVVFGRRAAFGGPFSGLGELRPGRVFAVTTAQGRHTYRVTGLRRAGDPVPPPVVPGRGRLTLVTATGAPFLPAGTLRVDAELVSPAQPAPPRLVTSTFLEPSERALHGDRSVLVTLVLWGQGLVLAACGVAWARARWGLRQAWVVGVPLLAAFGLAVAHESAQLLPNLM
ncbi:MAG: sortase [Frankiales bacterium]|nr:sortase [Frankiales bacterium]